MSSYRDYAICKTVNEIINYIKAFNPERILIQGADGFKNRLLAIKESILRANPTVDVIIDGDKCYGACDLPIDKIPKLKIDLLVHIGHTPFKYDHKHVLVPVIYVPLYYEKVELREDLLQEIFDLCSNYRVKFLYSIQYYPIYKWILSKIFRCKKASTLIKDSQSLVLGCNIPKVVKDTGNIDLFIVISSGIFHALGVAIWTGKKTILLDVHREQLIDMEKERKRILSIIATRIEKAKSAKKFGVITVNKSGQFNLDLSLQVCKRLHQMGKKVYHIILSEVTEENLQYFIDLDAFIQTGCPRISIDDQERFSRPILNYEQYLILIGEKRFEEVYPL